MIFPERTTEQWLIENKGLKISEGKCNHCGKIMTSTIPVITKSTIALISPECPCGKNTNGCMNFVLRTQSAKIEWLEAT